jgi:hypothetical protein
MDGNILNLIKGIMKKSVANSIFSDVRPRKEEEEEEGEVKRKKRRKTTDCQPVVLFCVDLCPMAYYLGSNILF